MNNIDYYKIGKFDTKYKLYKKEREVNVQSKYIKSLNHFVKDTFYMRDKIPQYEHLSQM